MNGYMSTLFVGSAVIVGVNVLFWTVCLRVLGKVYG